MKDPLVNYQYFGPIPDTRSPEKGLSVSEAHRVIGANVVAGFTAVVHNKTARGDLLTTVDGDPLTVVSLHGATTVISSFEFVVPF